MPLCSFTQYLIDEEGFADPAHPEQLDLKSIQNFGQLKACQEGWLRMLSKATAEIPRLKALSEHIEQSVGRPLSALREAFGTQHNEPSIQSVIESYDLAYHNLMLNVRSPSPYVRTEGGAGVLCVAGGPGLNRTWWRKEGHSAIGYDDEAQAKRDAIKENDKKFNDRYEKALGKTNYQSLCAVKNYASADQVFSAPYHAEDDWFFKYLSAFAADVIVMLESTSDDFSFSSVGEAQLLSPIRIEFFISTSPCLPQTKKIENCRGYFPVLREAIWSAAQASNNPMVQQAADHIANDMPILIFSESDYERGDRYPIYWVDSDGELQKFPVRWSPHAKFAWTVDREMQYLRDIEYPSPSPTQQACCTSTSSSVLEESPEEGLFAHPARADVLSPPLMPRYARPTAEGDNAHVPLSPKGVIKPKPITASIKTGLPGPGAYGIEGGSPSFEGQHGLRFSKRFGFLPSKVEGQKDKDVPERSVFSGVGKSRRNLNGLFREARNVRNIVNDMDSGVFTEDDEDRMLHAPLTAENIAEPSKDAASSEDGRPRFERVLSAAQLGGA